MQVWPEEWNEGTTKVERHDLIGGSDELAADEDGGERGGAAHPHEGFLNLFALRIIVNLMNIRANPYVSEQHVHCIAQTAGAFAKHHKSFV